MTNGGKDNPGILLPPEVITQLANLNTRMDAIERAVTRSSAGAHARMDKIEEVVGEQLKEIKQDVKDILAWVNRSKGGLATVLVLMAIVGGTVGAFVNKFFGRWN